MRNTKTKRVRKARGGRSRRNIQNGGLPFFFREVKYPAVKEKSTYSLGLSRALFPAHFKKKNGHRNAYVQNRADAMDAYLEGIEILKTEYSRIDDDVDILAQKLNPPMIKSDLDSYKQIISNDELKVLLTIYALAREFKQTLKTPKFLEDNRFEFQSSVINEYDNVLHLIRYVYPKDITPTLRATNSSFTLEVEIIGGLY